MKNKFLIVVISCCAFRSFASSPVSADETQVFTTAFTNATQTLKIELASGREQRRTNAVYMIWSTGKLTGFLADFCRKWPEQRFVWEPVRTQSGDFVYKTNGIIRGKRRERIKKFAEAEVAEGRIRNAAARKAVLNYFLYEMDNGDQYEQMEVSRFVFQTWDEGGGLLNRRVREEDGMTNLNAVIQKKIQDKNIAPATRQFLMEILKNGRSGY